MRLRRFSPIAAIAATLLMTGCPGWNVTNTNNGTTNVGTGIPSMTGLPTGQGNQPTQGGFNPGTLTPVNPTGGANPCKDILGGLQDVLDAKSTSSKASALKTWVNSSSFEQYLRQAADKRRDSGTNIDQSSVSTGGDVSGGLGAWSASGYYEGSDLKVRVWDKSSSASNMSVDEFRNKFNSEYASSMSEDVADQVSKRIANSEVVQAWRACITATNPGGSAGLQSEISQNGAQVVLKAKYVPSGDASVDAVPTIQGVILSPNLRADGTVFNPGNKVTVAGVIGSFTITGPGPVSIIVQTDKGAFEQKLGTAGVAPIVPVTPASEAPKPIVSDAPKPVVSDAPKPVVSDPPKPVVTDPPKPAPTPIPMNLYRFWSPDRGGRHNYSSNPAGLPAPWANDGTFLTVSQNSVPGLVPLYLLFNPSVGNYMLSSNANEASDYQNAGVLGYVSLSPGQLGMGRRIFRLWIGGHHLSTQNPDEVSKLQASGWVLDASTPVYGF
jgi:hypothetical protein